MVRKKSLRTVNTAVRLPWPVWTQARVRAVRSGVTMTELVANAIATYLRESRNNTRAEASSLHDKQGGSP